MKKLFLILLTILTFPCFGLIQEFSTGRLGYLSPQFVPPNTEINDWIIVYDKTQESFRTEKDNEVFALQDANDNEGWFRYVKITKIGEDVSMEIVTENKPFHFVYLGLNDHYSKFRHPYFLPENFAKNSSHAVKKS